MIIIKSSQLTVKINPLGAELTSIIDRNNEEYMWSGDPDVWSGVAPVLFPITGLLRDGYTLIKGERCEIPKHGFARQSLFEVVEHSESSCRLRLTDNDSTRSYYPFSFQFDVVFTVNGNDLNVQYDVTNTGDEPLPFSVGSHPAFQFPTSNVENYRLRLDTPDSPALSEVTEDGLVVPGDKPFKLSGESDIQITPTLFDHDALVFLNNQIRCVTLIHDDTARLKMHWTSTPNLGIWAKPNAPYVCIEPWQSYADSPTSPRDFYLKPGIRCLSAGQSDSDGYQITIL